MQKLSKGYLVRHFGPEGEFLYSLAHGFDVEQRLIMPEKIRAETVFRHDVNDLAEINHHIRYTADKLCYELRNKEMLVDRITLILKYSDNKTIQKTVTLSEQTDDFNSIVKLSQSAFLDLYTRRVAVKSITLSAIQPKTDTGQLELFETDYEHKQREIALGLERIRHKMGFEAIVNGSCLELAK